MRQIFDLHLHTNNSDGELSVEELINQVRANGLRFFSITDHDTIDSLIQIKKLDISDLNFIKGIEISSILDNKYKMHILGYDIDETNFDLIKLMEHLKRAREKRFFELADGLYKKYGFEFRNKDLMEIVSNTNIHGKPHLAALMVKQGYVKSVSEAFQKYLDNITTLTSNRMDARLVINTIKEAGGIAIWANPKKVEKEYNIDFVEILPRMMEIGIDGIEVFNSLHSLELPNILQVNF